MSLTITCDECGVEFARKEARGAFFDGDEARYRCPNGHWTEGPPPG